MNSSNDTSQPIILLIAPQMGENIGAAARAMHNFDIEELRIVNPRDGWPNEKALSMAANARPIIESAKLYNSIADAIADCHQVVATTARQRGVNKPETPIQQMHAQRPDGQKLALMFGPERTGLENEDIALATSLLHIPVNPDNPSLNLGQAVNIVCYEWFMQQYHVRDGGAAPILKGEGVGGYAANADHTPAPQSEMQALFDHLEGYLDAANFWNVPEKKPKMWQNIRASLTRAGLTRQETQTWHGVFRVISKNK